MEKVKRTLKMIKTCNYSGIDKTDSELLALLAEKAIRDL